MLMMRRLAKQGAKPVFHLGENPLIRQMFGVLSAAAKQEVAQMKMLGMLCEAALDVEQAAEYAILVCQMLENGAPVNKLHYVLMKKSCDREPLILNPWHGEASLRPNLSPPAHLWNQALSGQVQPLKFFFPAEPQAQRQGIQKSKIAEKNRLQFEFKQSKFKLQPVLIWRRRRDLNPRAGFPTYALSRGASSPLEYFSKMAAFIFPLFCFMHQPPVP